MMAWDVLLSPWLLGVLGLLVGSFLNVVVHRLPLMQERRWWGDVAAQLADGESHQRVFGSALPPGLGPAAESMTRRLGELPRLGLARPGSRCPHCGAAIRWYQNIPVLSWLALRGRCASCQAPIPVRYPLIELLAAALFAGAAWRFGQQPLALLWCGFLATLLVLSAIDWDTTLLPDDLTLPLLWVGLVAAAAGWTVPLETAVAGAVVGYGSLWSVYWLFKLTTGKEGMGYGDFKLLAALGAWLGWQAILPILLMASVIGAVVGIAMKVGGGLREGRYVPFGPFLAGGGAVVVFAGLPRLLDAIGWH
jgi:leader peptidase (prepilin peptidase)/N-methyltransferase